MKREDLDYNKNEFFWKKALEIEGNPYKLERRLEGFRSLLVFPTKEGDYSGMDYPLPFGYFASLVRMNGGSVNIHTQKVNSYERETFKGYDLIAFYPMVSLLKETIEIANKAGSENKDSKILLVNSDQHQHEMILCNPESKDLATKIMKKNERLDFVLIGEAEYSFIKLCDKIKNGENGFEEINSLLYRDRGEIKYSSGEIKPILFNFLPYASRDHLEKGIDSEGINHLSPRIQSSRGCVSPCLYCVESFMNIPKGDPRKSVTISSMERLIDEVELLNKEYGVIFFNSIDSSFEDPGKRGLDRVKNFYEGIIDREIEASFKIHMRAESVKKLSDNILNKLKYAGVDIFGVGSESGIEKELDSYKKIASPKDSLETILRLEKERDFFVIVGHMMFSPVLNLDDLSEKVEFLNKLNHGWDYLEMSNNIIIFPGTKYHRQMEERGLTKQHDELSPTIPYRYSDERVGIVSDIMGNIKKEFPKIIDLNNRFYDSLNIISRYKNKMNRHLWENGKPIIEFREKVEDSLIIMQKFQSNYFLNVVEKVRKGEKNTQATLDDRDKDLINSQLEKTNAAISELMRTYEQNGKKTNKLLLKTWMSLINSQVNTSGGKSGFAPMGQKN